MTIPHQGNFFDNICMTKSCFYALVDALTSRGLLPHGQTSRVSSIEEFALFMQTVGMHKRHRDNMERFQYLLKTINRRFHRVLSALCAKAPELITRPSFTETHTRITNNPDFYPFFKDCVGAIDGTLVPAWVLRVDQNRYQSHGISQISGGAGFPQDLHWTLNVEQRFMWMIVDDNTRAPMRDDALAEAQMGHWACGLHRHFGDPYTRDQVCEKFYELKRRFNQFDATTQLPGIFYDIETFVMVFPSELRPCASRYYPLASQYYQYPEPHYPSMLEVWGPIRLPGVPTEDQGVAQDNERINSLRSPVRRGVDAPIVISDSAAPSVQTHTHIASWDAVEHVTRGDGGPQMAHSTSLSARRSLDMGSEVGGIGCGHYIRHFGVQSDRGAQTGK
ncbi:hypothetical protein Sango_2438700 [Sesamum angolense]|uniref:DUF8040 domain-containing protein n=1 Tax=Sesamum angolense TaxID=2727404 RepID=A0AAE1W7R8_9LAMI|nr:hypothetical protein Sango_2438700 [Sesamum angolense]